jgi:S1-C subfamily serine protease
MSRRRRLLARVLAAALLWPAGMGPAADAPGVEASVVRIVNHYHRPDWYTPWSTGFTGQGTGSGFVIAGRKILTNAHVVSDARLLLVHLHGDPTPRPARVEAIGHDCDLALLALEDPAPLEAVPPLPIGGLPSIRSEVVTYGYAAGGHVVSFTAGVVSRIESQSYAHSGIDEHLAGQTDAAINPGNSGGPVLQEGRVVGVAFQANRRMENMGFFIPAPVVRHFLEDLEDGVYAGFPDLGLVAAGMENPALRRYAGLEAGESGVRVERVFRGSDGEPALREGDVILAVEGRPVANDGTIEWNGLRVGYAVAVDLLQAGQCAALRLVRDGRRLDVRVPLTARRVGAGLRNVYDRRPQYYVHAGLVFVPLNRETLRVCAERGGRMADALLWHETFFRPLEEDGVFDEPRVLLIRRLDHQSNAEAAPFLYGIVGAVNGRPVRTLEDAIAAFETPGGDQHVVEAAQLKLVTVLDRREADAAHPEILRQYGVAKDRRL